MDSDEVWSSPVLRRELHHQAEIIIGLASRVAHLTDYPTSAPRCVCELVTQLTRLVQQHIAQAPDDQLKHLSVMLCGWTEHLRYVERAKTADTPWSIVLSVERFFRPIVGGNPSFIVRPQWSYNYQIHELISPLRQNMAALRWIPLAVYENLFPNELVFVLSFPRVERINVTLHANWGHEVGHVIARRWIEKRLPALWQPIEDELKGELQRELGIRPEDNGPTASASLRIAEYVKRGLRVIEKGLLELIADAVGVHLLGPASLLAAAEYAARHDLDVSPLAGRYYPPWRYRLRRMYEQCAVDLVHIQENFSDDPVFESFIRYCCRLQAVTCETTDVSTLRVNGLTKVCYDAIDREWENIRHEALTLLSSSCPLQYKMMDRVSALRAIADRLAAHIPPNDVGTYEMPEVARFEDLLNGGWLEKLRLPLNASGELEGAETLYRLLLKGIESTFLQFTYGPELVKLEKI